MSNEDKVIHTISCGTCLFRQIGNSYEILLVRPSWDHDTWGVPKGHVEIGESFEQCAIRETLEETGLTAILGYRLQDVKVKHAKEHKVVKTWMATLNENAQRFDTDGENYAIAWHPIDSLPEIHKYQVSLLAEVVKFLKSI